MWVCVPTGKLVTCKSVCVRVFERGVGGYVEGGRVTTTYIHTYSLVCTNKLDVERRSIAEALQVRVRPHTASLVVYLYALFILFWFDCTAYPHVLSVTI